MRCRQKLRKLVALMSLAYAFCLSVGIRAAEKKPIVRKKHGYPATSLSRYGLNILRQLSRPGTEADEKLARMVGALLRWFYWQTAICQIIVEIVG